MEDSSPKPMTKFRLRFLIASVFCFYFTSLSAQQWQSLGPFKPGIPNGTDKGISRASGIGRVSCIRPDTNDSLLLFCGSPYGALYKSADSGKSWTTFAHLQGVSDYVVSPKNKKVQFIVTGDPDCILNPNEPALGSESCQSRGILKSIDGGKTWTTKPIGLWHDSSGFVIKDFWKFATNKVIRKLVISPASGQMFAVLHTYNYATKSFDGYVYESRDEGKNWFVSLYSPDGFLKGIALHSKKPKTIFAAGRFIYQSVNSGRTWTKLNNDSFPADSLLKRIEIAIAPSDPDRIYALFVSPSLKKNVIYMSSDGGKIFSKIGAYASSPEWRTSLAVNPHDKSEICFTTSNTIAYVKVVQSRPNLVYLNSAIHDDVHEIVFQKSGHKVFVGTDGGLYSANAGSNVWDYISNGQNIAECWGVSVSKNDSSGILVGLQDCGTILYKSDSTLNSRWMQVRGGDGMKPAFDFFNSEIAYSVDGNNNLTTRSDNGGVNFSKNIRVPGAPAGQYLRKIACHPLQPNAVYTAYKALYKSNDKGDHWTMISPDSLSEGFISDFAVAPSDSSCIYLAYGNPCWSDVIGRKLFFSGNGGVTWTDVTAGLTGVKYCAITSITVDPFNPYHVAVGFRGGWEFRVMTSEAAGINGSWVDNSIGLPGDCDVYSLIFDKSNPQRLYAGTLKGVWELDFSSSKWQRTGENLPDVMVSDLDISYDRRELYAATHGYGLWKLKLRD